MIQAAEMPRTAGSPEKWLDHPIEPLRRPARLVRVIVRVGPVLSSDRRQTEQTLEE